jgi:hypothetical protein
MRNLQRTPPTERAVGDHEVLIQRHQSQVSVGEFIALIVRLYNETAIQQRDAKQKTTTHQAYSARDQSENRPFARQAQR